MKTKTKVQSIKQLWWADRWWTKTVHTLHPAIMWRCGVLALRALDLCLSNCYMIFNNNQKCLEHTYTWKGSMSNMTQQIIRMYSAKFRRFLLHYCGIHFTLELISLTDGRRRFLWLMAGDDRQFTLWIADNNHLLQTIQMLRSLQSKSSFTQFFSYKQTLESSFEETYITALSKINDEFKT